MRVFFSIYLLLILVACRQDQTLAQSDSVEIFVPELYAVTFDFPVGKPPLKGYYNAQGFGKNNHLGDDWNGVSGGNTDLGDPVYSIANGRVVYAEDYGPGWGNIVRIVHYLEDSTQVESLYAHFDEIQVEVGQWVKLGDQIGTIGNANGTYPAHLHLEIREDVSMDVGGGYSRNTFGYLDPTKFIESHQ